MEPQENDAYVASPDSGGAPSSCGRSAAGVEQSGTGSSVPSAPASAWFSPSHQQMPSTSASAIGQQQSQNSSPILHPYTIGSPRRQPSSSLTNNSVVTVNTNKWFPGAHIEFYVTRPLKMNLIGIGELTDLHQFVWLNKDRAKLVNTGDAYLIIPSNLPFDVLARYGKQFREIEKPVIINQIRSGVVVRYFYVYRMRGYRE